MLFEFNPSQLMALRSVVAEHMLCPAHTEVFVDVGTGVETTIEDLLVLLVHGTRAPATQCPSCRGCGRIVRQGDRVVPWIYLPTPTAVRPEMCTDCGGTGVAHDVADDRVVDQAATP